MDLTGKWKYKENYGYGMAEGEVSLEQEGNRLAGRIVFMDKTEDDEVSMIQEFLVGEVEDRKVKLQAEDFDVIHADYRIDYKLDSWFGILVDEQTIKGVSVDYQGIEGSFIFKRIADKNGSEKA